MFEQVLFFTYIIQMSQIFSFLFNSYTHIDVDTSLAGSHRTKVVFLPDILEGTFHLFYLCFVVLVI